MIEKKPDKHLPDRPLECSECKKPIAVRYTEIVGDISTSTSMCSDCPELHRRLYGTNPKEFVATQTGSSAGLECGNCGTTLEEVKRGHRLGCAVCYTVFEDVLILEIQAADCLPPKTTSNKKGYPLHIGRSPGETLTINPSSRLLALNEALKETLNREDYEQAALLRDQIKALTDNDISEEHRKQEEDRKDQSKGKENEPE